MGFVVFGSAGRDSKDGAGTQDERSEGLSASQGRERYIFIHENNRLLTESRRTFKNQLKLRLGRFLLVRREAKCLGDILRGIRRPCQQFCDWKETKWRQGVLVM
jgi:hypothetical protein